MDGDKPNPGREAVMAISREMTTKAGGGAALAQLLWDQYGIGTKNQRTGEYGPYSQQAVSAWRTGRVRPLAEVLLAAAVLTDTAVGPFLSPGALAAKVDRLEERLDRLTQALGGRSILESETVTEP